MIDFNLVRKEPSVSELRAYVYQIIIDNFGLSERLREQLKKEFPGLDGEFSQWDINAISGQDITRILQDQYLLPGEIYYFKKENNSAEVPDSNYKIHPDIFTRICQVSFDKGGLIVMERHHSQIYELYDAKGKCYLGPCHDLDLGTDGKVLLRTSESIFWELLQYDPDGFEDIGIFGPFDSPSDFPYIGERDVIPEMLPIGTFIENEFNQSETLTDEEVSNKLENDRRAYKYLQNYYSDYEDLAVKAVNSNLYAFTFLSERLQGNREFVTGLISQKSGNLRLYDFLDDILKRDIGIVRLCIKANPHIIRNIAPVSDRELMQEALKDHVYNLEYASDDLKADKKLVLSLVMKDWCVLREASKDLLSDSSFIAEAISCYNENEKEEKIPEENQVELPFLISKKKKTNLNEVINYMVIWYPRILKHIAPTSDMITICKCLKYTFEEDIPFIIDCISEDLKKTKVFWMEAVRQSLYMLKNAPIIYKQDKDVVLSAVCYNGELIGFAGEDLRGDPEVFLAAIYQIANRSGTCDPAMIIHLMPDRLKSDKEFLLQVIADYPRIFKHVPLDIRSNPGFMLKVIAKTYGWIIKYASIALQSDRRFIVEAAKANRDILEWLPERIRNDYELRSLLNKEGINYLQDEISDLPF